MASYVLHSLVELGTSLREIPHHCRLPSLLDAGQSARSSEESGVVSWLRVLPNQLLCMLKVSLNN